MSSFFTVSSSTIAFLHLISWTLNTDHSEALSAPSNQSKRDLEAGIHSTFSLLGPHQAESFRGLKQQRIMCQFIVIMERKKKVGVKISQLLSYPYQQFQLITHPFHEVFTLSLVPSDNLSYFNENITNSPKFPLNLNSAHFSLSTETYYEPVKFLTFHGYVRRNKTPHNSCT